jgi:(3S)-malyl-CoA thioesterase
LDIAEQLRFVRSALYVPGSNARALEKARGLDADLIIIDLEDAVPDEAKADARAAASAFAAAGDSGKLIAIRVNAIDSVYHAEDVAALNEGTADFIVLPKVDTVRDLPVIALPILAMIETPTALYAARDIAAHCAVAGLIAGTNDLVAETGIRPGPERQGLELALQTIVLAAAAAGKPRFDGVCNRLDDLTGFDAECRQGAAYGFTGKTLIHPNQIAACNKAFGPSEADVADAEALIAASRGGAQRFRGRMIESMHVEGAKLTIERFLRATGAAGD